ncbi:MAG: flagellar biosynthetic protein FliR [Vicinamibacterales bacterium]
MIELTPIVRLGLLLVRPGMLIVSAPLFGGAYAPTLLKVGLTVIIGVALIPLVPLPPAGSPIDLTLVVTREALVGLALGFSLRVLLAGMEFAGHLAGFQLGFTYASVVDPQSGIRNGVVSALYGTIALVIFFGINAHHDLLRALAQSFQVLPVGRGGIGPDMSQTVTSLFGLVFVVAAQLAAPVIIVLLVTELGLGLLSRAAPMLNLMAQGFPIRLLVGLLALMAALRAIPGVLTSAFPRALQLGTELAGVFR